MDFEGERIRIDKEILEKYMGKQVLGTIVQLPFSGIRVYYSLSGQFIPIHGGKVNVSQND